jgi:YbbR domain-containing protein
LNNLTKEQIKAYIDLKNVDVGIHTVPVRLVAPTEVKLIKLSPKNVKIEIDRVIEKVMLVEDNLIGSQPKNYVLDEPEILPRYATIKGYGKKVNKVRHLIATFDISNLSKDTKKYVEVRAINDEGKEIDGIVIDPKKVKMKIKVSPIIVREVNVKLNLRGNLASGFKIEKIILDPDKAIIQGAEDKISKLQSITTSPIKISGLSSDLEQEINLLQPDGVVSLMPNVVKVIIKVSKEE